jgi:RNA-directed DNA polymerase
MATVRARIRALTGRRLVGWSIGAVVNRLNRSLRSWAAYFRYGNSARKFDLIDSYVHERLAILASNKHGMSGRNWKGRFNGVWLSSLDVHRLQGTVRRDLVHA